MSDIVVFDVVTDSRGETQYGESRSGICFHATAAKWERENLKPNTEYAVMMIPVPDDYRLATDEDMKGPMPQWTITRTQYQWVTASRECGWNAHHIYAIPTVTPEQKRKQELRERIEEAKGQLEDTAYWRDLIDDLAKEAGL